MHFDKQLADASKVPMRGSLAPLSAKPQWANQRRCPTSEKGPTPKHEQQNSHRPSSYSACTATQAPRDAAGPLEPERRLSPTRAAASKRPWRSADSASCGVGLAVECWCGAAVGGMWSCRAAAAAAAAAVGSDEGGDAERVGGDVVAIRKGASEEASSLLRSLSLRCFFSFLKGYRRGEKKKNHYLQQKQASAFRLLPSFLSPRCVALPAARSEYTEPLLL